MKITQSDVLDALRDFAAPRERPAGAFTMREAAALLGRGDCATRNYLRRIADAGRLEVVRFEVLSLDGRSITTVGYRIKKK